jgi:hypothetical protein
VYVFIIEEKHNVKECVGRQFVFTNEKKNRCKECNIGLYLINLQRSNIHRILKRTTINKSGHAVEYLGCESYHFKSILNLK